MVPGGITMVGFSSESTPGIVNLGLGYVPDFVIIIANHGATNPDIYLWANVGEIPGWAAALSLKITGSTGVVTRDTTGITVYAGGDIVDADNSLGMGTKLPAVYRKRDGSKPAEDEMVSEGITIPADNQAGANLVIAFRRDE